MLESVMKKVEFEYYVSFGRGDSSDYIDCFVELTDEEWERLDKFYKEHPGECAFDRNNIANFDDIHEKFVDAAIEADYENRFDFDDMYSFLEDEREDFDPDDPEAYEITEADFREYMKDYVSLGIVEKIPE